MVPVSITPTLANIGIQTIRLLNKVKIANSPTKSTHHEWPKALFAAEADRFELWAVNLGVFVSGHGSLDYRVREAESLEHTLRRFMTDLVAALEEVLEYCSEDGQAANQNEYGTAESVLDEFQKSLEDDFSDGTSQDIESDIDLLLESVRDPIDRLYKLSTRIRNPSSRLGSIKAQRHQQVDQDSGIDLFAIFEAFDHDYARSIFLQFRKSKALGESAPRVALEPLAAEESPDYADHVWEPIRTVLLQNQTSLSNSTESFLIRRIACANVRRRQQFSYWKKHRDKLSQHTLELTRPLNTPRNTILGQSHSEYQATHSGLRKPPTPSVTTASILNIPQLNASDNKSTASVSEYAPSAWQPDKELLGFPDPPLRRPGEKFFECPFCFTLCSTNILAPRAWKAHLIHDLRPYICTYKDCKTPDQQYDTRQDWIFHENTSHRMVWRCPEHPAQTFLQLEIYREHLHVEHSDHDDEISGNSMINAGKSTLESPDRCCPICLLNIETLSALQSHIALHLERFSIFSLPRSVDTDGDANEDDSYKANPAAEGSRVEDFDMDSEFDGEYDKIIPATSIARQRWTKVLTEISLRLKSNEGTTSNLGSIQSALMKWIGKRYRKDQHDQDIMNDQALKHMNRGELLETEIMFQQMRDIRTLVLGQEHPDTLTSMDNLALTYENQERWEEAKKLKAQVMQIRKRILGEKHPETPITPVEFEHIQVESRSKWLTCMDEFAEFIKSVRAPDEPHEEVVIALIDDGIDINEENFAEHVIGGRSFYPSSETENLSRPYYITESGHGSAMATLICRVFPMARLYVLKLDEQMSENGKKRITAKSAAKAIYAAVYKKVQIISMSWSIERTSSNNEDIHELEAAIENAAKAGILMFCAASDSGHIRDTSLPGDCRKTKEIFKIGAAEASGFSWDWVGDPDQVDFVFPGYNAVKKHWSNSSIENCTTLTGSSVATALAAGFAALILYCVHLGALNTQSSKLQERLGINAVTMEDYEAMKRHQTMNDSFLKIGINRASKEKYIEVWNIFRYNAKFIGADNSDKLEIVTQIASQLKPYKI